MAVLAVALALEVFRIRAVLVTRQALLHHKETMVEVILRPLIMVLAVVVVRRL
jgi:excinuclease UvrABC helicase subunit UvrB